MAPGLHLGGVGVPVSLRHNSLSIVRIRGSSFITNINKYPKRMFVPGGHLGLTRWSSNGMALGAPTLT